MMSYKMSNGVKTNDVKKFPELFITEQFCTYMSHALYTDKYMKYWRKKNAKLSSYRTFMEF